MQSGCCGRRVGFELIFFAPARKPVKMNLEYLNSFLIEFGIFEFGKLEFGIFEIGIFEFGIFILEYLSLEYWNI